MSGRCHEDRGEVFQSKTLRQKFTTIETAHIICMGARIILIMRSAERHQRYVQNAIFSYQLSEKDPSFQVAFYL